MKIWRAHFYFVILLNLNSLIYGLAASYYENKECILWSLSHYLTFFIVLFLFSEVYVRLKFKSKSGKRIFLCSIFLSLAAILNGWYMETREFFSAIFLFLTAIQLLIGMSNIVLIIKCYKLVYEEDNENPKKKMTLNEEIIEVSNFLKDNTLIKSRKKDLIYSAALSGFTYLLIIVLYIIIPPVLKYSDNRDCIIYLSLPFIIALNIVNKLKNDKYFVDSNKAFKASIIDSILIMGGLTFYYYFEGVVYHKTGEYNFIVMAISIFMLLPVLNTNYKIFKEYHKFLSE